MNTIIEKIRAEVNRQRTYYNLNNPYDKRAIRVCNNILSTLGNLEKEEKPIEGLEEELVKYIGYPEENLDGKWKKKEVESIAHHFYELGRQSKPVLSDDLEKAAREYAMDDFYNGYSSGSIIEDTMKNFKAGAEWGRRNLLQEIADGKTHPVDGITAAWLDNTEE